ncbi:NUDIX domain-containing protein [Acinetobacter sp.]|uniref:NUDIX domain-containing protein n=1 Tax=Acinetobacter sp. TaxID=472 RepID=UPI003751FA55
MKNTNTVGVIVGRFQVAELHTAHIELIHKALMDNDRVVIFLGTTVVRDSEKNALDYRTRELMLSDAFYDHWDDCFERTTICPLPDQHSDELWSAELDRRIREIDPMGKIRLYAGRDSFAGHYKGNFEIILVDEILDVSGTDDRKQIASCPIGSVDFRKGVIHAKANQYPKVHPCIDVLVVRRSSRGVEMLLGQKYNESKWRLIGGFADPTDESFEDAAKREVGEETKLHVRNLKYICSRRVKDWRYEREQNKIITTFFEAEYVSGVETPSDDIAFLNWFSIEELMLMKENIGVGHIPLIEAYMTNYGYKWQQ